MAIIFQSSVPDPLTIGLITVTGGLVSNLGAGAPRFDIGYSNGTALRVASDSTLVFVSTSNASTGTIDTGISRISPGLLAAGTGTAGSSAGALVATNFFTSAGNGGTEAIVPFNESLTIAAAATTDSATTIPAGSQIIAVSVRVTTIIPTAATFTVIAATGGTTFNTAAVAVAAGSTDAGTAAGGATYTAAGTKIRITPNLTPGAATGVVRISGYYRVVTPPTS